MKIGKLRINMIQNEAYTDLANAYANVGESIQVVAIEYIYHQLGIQKKDIVKIDQCNIKKYEGEKVILPLRLPISSENVDDFFPLPGNIIPIFMSLHLHDDIFSDREDLVNYFKQYAPIGCRDEYSCNYFKKHGIESYIMGCYTLCLPERKERVIADKVYVVDASKELMDALPEDIKRNGTYVSHAVRFHEYPVTHREDDRLVETAKGYLERYMETASMIVTSRIHAAAPCMAMGIPVILATNNADFRYAWIDRFLPVYQLEDYENIDWSPERVEMREVRDILFEFFEKAIETGKADRNCLEKLDTLYRERRKTQYYKSFRNRILKLREKYQMDAKFSYVIWGGGCHAHFAYDLMNELYPKARLCAVVDKYKKGVMFGVPIIKGEELRKYNVDHVCITTNPGKAEAVKECERLAPMDKYFYTLITSQQIS